MNFVHIGAGAGDLDPSSNFRDGFTEFVKNKKNKKYKHKHKHKHKIIIKFNLKIKMTI